MGGVLPVIAVVTKQTRLQNMKRRWVTSGAFGFRMQQAASHEVERRVKRMRNQGQVVSETVLMDLEQAVDCLADEDLFESEDSIYQSCVQSVLRDIDLGFPLLTLDRTQVPTFDFGRCVAVVVIGPDGLVANTAKYAEELPIIGVNPDPEKIDGVLLPFQPIDARRAVQKVIKNEETTEKVTLAEVITNDGQSMLAFNDFYIGCKSHVSARYILEERGQTEPQSSSGVLVSTGAGSTGWFSSVLNMTNGVMRFFHQDAESSQQPDRLGYSLSRDERKLVWAVREPFKSRHSDTKMIAGVIQDGEELILASQIAQNGVIFSDGIEEDFLEFNLGTIARFSVSRKSANLVLPQ